MRRHLVAFLPPVFLAAAPILLLAANNYDQVSWNAVVPPLLVSVASALALFGLGFLIYRNAYRASVLTAAVLFAFFSYGHLHLALASTGLFAQTRYVHYLLMPLWLAGLVAVAWYLARTRRDLRPLCQSLMTLSLAVCLIASTQWMLYGEAPATIATTAADDFVQHGLPLDEASRRLGKSTELPDIYYIILDGYARNDVLQNCYAIDNGAFTEDLRERGFFVGERSTSNYAMTYLSLASSLNMRYVQDSIETHGASDGNRAWAHAMLWNHQVGRMLQAVGYRYIHLQTNWSGTQHSEIADVTMPKTLPEFDVVLANTTMLKPLMSMRMLPNLTGPTGGELHRYTFDALDELAAADGPKFVFAHLICPHPPHVVDEQGSVRDAPHIEPHQFASMPLWRDREGYLGQLRFCNRRILEFADTVERGQREAILIVQADHGSASQFDVSRPAAEQPEFIWERTAILNAYRVPESIRQRLTPDITPVNTFRIILGELLKLPIDPLEEKVFFSWYDHPHEFVDVSGSVRNVAEP